MTASSTRLPLAAGLAAALVGAGARAECEAEGMPEGPLTVGYFDGDFGVARRACPRTEIALRPHGVILVDSANFYGTIGAGGEVAGSLKLAPRVEGFLAIDAVSYRFVQNATIKQTRITLGQASVGATYLLQTQQKWAVAGTARLSFPTSTLYQNAWPFGLELAAALQAQARSTLQVHAGLGLLGSAAITVGNPQPRLGVDLVAGVEWRPLRWLEAVLDLKSLLFHSGALDHLAVAIGARLQIARGTGVELAVMLPLAGATRVDYVGALRLSYRFAQ